MKTVSRVKRPENRQELVQTRLRRKELFKKKGFEFRMKLMRGQGKKRFANGFLLTVIFILRAYSMVSGAIITIITFYYYFLVYKMCSFIVFFSHVVNDEIS